MLFELVHRALLPRSEKRDTITGPHLYIMEILSTYQKVKLPVLVIEHFNTVMFVNNGKHALPYGFWMNKLFAYFFVKC